jgi:Trypsin-like peptidase domain
MADRGSHPRNLLPAKIAVAYVRTFVGSTGKVTRRATRVGTAFAVTRRMLITARHCVDNELTGGHQVQLGFIGRDFRTATVSALPDTRLARLDIVDGEIPLGKQILTYASDLPSDGGEWRAAGFPISRPISQVTVVSGYITSTSVDSDDNGAAMVLFCRESAAGQTLIGMSGAPVAARFDDGGSTFAVIDYAFAGAEDGARADGGTLYAVPISQATSNIGGSAERFAQIKGSTIEKALKHKFPKTAINNYARAAMYDLETLITEEHYAEMDLAAQRDARRSSFWGSTHASLIEPLSAPRTLPPIGEFR